MRILALLQRHKMLILYLFYGACTTLVNMLAYWLCYSVAHMGNVVSVIIAWLLAVFFAFVTNKLWVFGSKDTSPAVLLREGAAFVYYRLLTGLMDVAIMYVAVDVCLLNPNVWKLVANILVIIANWLASKWIIFAKAK